MSDATIQKNGTIKMDRITLKGNERLQEYFFKKCIIETPSYFGNLSKYNIRIDHFNGKNYLNNSQYPILFPRSTFEYVSTLSKEKDVEYYFKGVITEKRKWIKKYEDTGIILNSNSGRDRSIKYDIDIDYFRSMCSSKFTLTPTGDCPWSYRFFEAIMCYSIPILEDDIEDVYQHLFKTYRHSDQHVYDPLIVEYNIKILLDNFIPFETKNI